MEGEGQIKEEMSYILVSQLPKYKQFIGQPLSCHSVKGGLGNLPHRNFISKLGIQRRAIIIIIGGKVKVSRRADRGEKKKKKKKKKKTKSAKTRKRKRKRRRRRKVLKQEEEKHEPIKPIAAKGGFLRLLIV